MDRWYVLPSFPTHFIPIHTNSIRERVEEELEEARSEGFALMGPDYDVVEREEEKVRAVPLSLCVDV